MATSTIADQLKRHGSQGAKVVQCAACHGDIQPYAGQPVSLIGKLYAHHPGQCAGASERASQVRDKAVQGELFAWSCTRVEPGSASPVICSELGTDRDEYVRHMTSHGLKPISTPAPIRLRRKAPAAKLAKPIVNPFKFLNWTENGTGRRGQYWADGPGPQSVWVVPLQPAAWEVAGRPAKPVLLYSHGDGTWSTDFSRAKWDRRDANRRAKRNAA
jgi:hypothetical protein